MIIAESWAYKLVGARKAEVMTLIYNEDECKNYFVLERLDCDDKRIDFVLANDPENKYQKYLLKNMNRTGVNSGQSASN